MSAPEAQRRPDCYERCSIKSVFPLARQMLGGLQHDCVMPVRMQSVDSQPVRLGGFMKPHSSPLKDMALQLHVKVLCARYGPGHAAAVCL